MATISNNEIKIKYTLDTTDLSNATALFDRLSAEDRQLLNDLKRLQAQMQQTGQAGTNAMNQVGQATSRAGNQINSLKGPLSSIQGYITSAFAVGSIVAFGKACIDAAIKLESLQKAIEFTAGSMIGGAANFQYLKKLAEEFGIPLQAAAEGFKSMSAAANRNNISMQNQREMFRDLTKAMSALNVTSQDASLIMFGFGQMISKPKVSAQELYHQIGERLPLAIQAAVMALQKLRPDLQVTDGLLIKMVEDGEVFSKDFVPEFTKALGKLGESGAYVETLGKEVTRLTNSWEEFKASFVGGLPTRALTVVLEYLANINNQIKYYLDNYGAFGKIASALTFGIVGPSGLALQEKAAAAVTGKASLEEAEKRKKQEIEVYDFIISSSTQRYQRLTDLQKEYQNTLTDQTQVGEQKRKQIEDQFSNIRIGSINLLQADITKRLEKIKTLEGEVDQIRREKVGGLFGWMLGDQMRNQWIEDRMAKIGIVKSELEAFRKLMGEIPTLTPPPAPDPEDAERKRRKARQAMEDAYRRELAYIMALKEAEDDRIKAKTKPGTVQDIKLLENSENFGRKLLAIDLKYQKKGLEEARNNAIKRRSQIELDDARQTQLVEEANAKALKMEEDYIKKNQEIIEDAARKRRKDMQTDEQNELDQSKDFYGDKLAILYENFEKASTVQGIEDKVLIQLKENYKNERIALEEEEKKALAAINAKYREKEKLDTIRTQYEINDILIQAAGIRAEAQAKTDMERLMVNSETSLALIQNEKNSLREEMKLNQQNTTLSVAEVDNRNKLILAKLDLLSAQEIEINKKTEDQKLQYKEEVALAIIDLTQSISDNVFGIYQAQLNKELAALNKKYQSDVELADGNKQKLAQIEQDKNLAEAEIKRKQFMADRMAAVARVIFETAAIIARQTANPIEWPLVGISLGAQATQLAAIFATPVPEFAEGTKGRKFKGGPAIVGERGVEKVVTESGKVYFTPNQASLVELPKGSQVIPNHALSQKELFWANALNNGRPINPGSGIENKLTEIGSILQALPVHQINMNEKGFEKFIRTERRTTKILNNRFPSKH